MAPLRVLAVTNMYPTKDDRTFGIFVEQQIESLRALGILVSVLFLNRRKEGRRAYWRIDPMLREWIHRLDPDVVHVMYGGVLAERVTRHVTSRPVIVTYHGSDLQGVGRQGPIVSLTSRYGVWASIRAARRASGVVAVAEHLVKRLPPEIDRRRVRVILRGRSRAFRAARPPGVPAQTELELRKGSRDLRHQQR